MDLYFSDYFGVEPELLDEYGALDNSLASDLPLFIDPFLLFNSEKTEYRALHDGIIKYLVFLRDHARQGGELSHGEIDAWYRFKEVKQNWLGFTVMDNAGAGLGPRFARSLHGALTTMFTDFGDEKITEGSHLEKLCLIEPGVGRDSISDFTTNLIKDFLLRYTQAFAEQHIDPSRCRHFTVPRSVFDYEGPRWNPGRYYLPKFHDDFVLLTPMDLLTQDETWISHPGMLRRFDALPKAVNDAQLRAEINAHFARILGKQPSQSDRAAAKVATIRKYPVLIDVYIKDREDHGDDAVAASASRVADIRAALIDQVKAAVEALDKSGGFYTKPSASYDEALARVKWFKHYVEHEDGYLVINRAGLPFAKEKELQIFFGSVWFATDFDVNREPNNGRGPVDVKVSRGSKDKTLIEWKLASNRQLKRNLERQVEVYKTANRTDQAIKAIVAYTAEDERRVQKIIRDVGLQDDPSVILIDARSDNKPSASKA